MAIAFVSAGAYNSTTGSTSATPANPSQTTNDLLIAWCSVEAAVTISVSGAGWTLGNNTGVNNQSIAWAWAIAGTTVNPTFSWTGAHNYAAQVLQFSGNQTVTPTGGNSIASVSAGSSLTVPGVTTTANNSGVVAVVCSGANQFVTGYLNWGTNETANNNPNGTSIANLGIVNVSGSSSSALVVGAYPVMDMAGFQVEIVGTGASPGAEKLRATGVVTQVLESYTPAAKVRASGSYLQVLESYTAAAPKLRATGVYLQVLRTQPNTATPTGIIKPELSVLQRGHPLAQGLIMAWLFDEMNLRTTLLNIDKGVFEKISNTSVSATAGTVQWLSNSLAIGQGAPNGSAIDYRSSGQVDTNIWTPVEGLKQITIATRCNNYSSTSANGGWVLSKGNTPELGLSNLTDLKTWFYFNNTGISSAASAVPPQTWGDLVATYDGANQRIFWNNVQVASGALASNTSPVTGTHLLFGDRGAATANYDIDCIMIWNRALSQQEIGQWSFDPYAMFRMRTINVYRIYPVIFDVSGLVEIEW